MKKSRAQRKKQAKLKRSQQKLKRRRQKAEEKAEKQANSKSKPSHRALKKTGQLTNKRIKVQYKKRGGPYPRCIDFQDHMTFLITRRCLGRVFRLPPDDATRKLFEYFLAYAAKRYRIAINAVVIMSNHYHLVVSATRWNSDISGFMHCLNHNTAKVLNRRQGRRGPLYEVKPFDIRPLNTEEDILRAMTYVVYNPVKAGLTEEPADWPGLVSTFEDYGTERETVDRPDFFGEASEKPETIKLEIVRPVHFKNLTEEEWQNLLKESGNKYRDDVHQQRAEAGLSFLGREAILNQSINDTPTCPDIDKFELAEADQATSYSPFNTKKLEEEAYKAKQDSFRKLHHECMEKVKAGERPTFPYPTIKMVQTYGFPMEPKTSTAETPELHHFPERVLE